MSTQPYEYILDIDLSEPYSMFDIETHQLDTIYLKCNIYNQGILYDCTNATVILQAHRETGNDYIQTNFDILQGLGYVNIKCTDQLTVDSGLVKAELRLKFSNGTIQSTSRIIYIKVIPSVLEINRKVSPSTLTALQYVDTVTDKLASIKSNLTNDINNANTASANIENEIAKANTKISDVNMSITNANSSLTNIITQANNKISDVNNTINNVNNTQTSLRNTTTQVIAEVNNTINDVNTTKSDLQNVVSQSSQIKNDLTNLNSITQTTESDLQAKINEANNIKIALQTFDPNGIVQNTNDMLNKMNSVQLLLTINHGLNAYPSLQLIWTEYGAGVGGAGTFPAGANSICDSIANKIEYVDNNNVNIYVPQLYYVANPIVTKLSNYKYIVNFTGSTKSLLIQIRV